MPFPGTHVFHPDWETHHRPVAEGAQTATGIIRRYSSTGVHNDATGKTEYPPPTVVYGVDEPAQGGVLLPQRAGAGAGDDPVGW